MRKKIREAIEGISHNKNVDCLLKAVSKIVDRQKPRPKKLEEINKVDLSVFRNEEIKEKIMDEVIFHLEKFGVTEYSCAVTNEERFLAHIKSSLNKDNWDKSIKQVMFEFITQLLLNTIIAEY